MANRSRAKLEIENDGERVTTGDNVSTSEGPRPLEVTASSTGGNSEKTIAAVESMEVSSPRRETQLEEGTGPRRDETERSQRDDSRTSDADENKKIGFENVKNREEIDERRTPEVSNKAETGNKQPLTSTGSAALGEDSVDSSRTLYRATTIASKNVINQFGSSASPKSSSAPPDRTALFRSPPSPTSSLLTPGASLSLMGRSPEVGVGWRSSRERAKKEMQELNDRLIGYIEKGRFLEAQNRHIADELASLKRKLETETSGVKTLYQTELDETRKLLEDGNREKGNFEVRVASLEDDLEELKTRLDDSNEVVKSERIKSDNLIQQIVNVEAENNLLRRRLQVLESDRERDKKVIQQLREQLANTRADLDNETLLHLDAENRRQTLEDQLEFLKNLHEQEMKELADLMYRDCTSENREYWRIELGLALRDIQQAFDERLDRINTEQDAYYRLKAQELQACASHNHLEVIHVREENDRLHRQLELVRAQMSDAVAKNSQLARDLESLRHAKSDIEGSWSAENGDIKGKLIQLRAELEALAKDLELSADTKLALQLEIIVYRKLLEGDENRNGLRKIVEILTSDLPYTSFRIRDQEDGVLPAKTTYQRNAKGPIAIADVSIEGKFVQLENSGNKDEDLGEWRLVRNIDGEDEYDVVLPKSFVVKAGEKVKIWAKGQSTGQETLTSDFEINQASWGVGFNLVLTRLLDSSGEERANYTQTTVFG